MNNKIFMGPPGSGKTYWAKYEVVKTIWDLIDEAEREAGRSRYYNPANFCEEAFNYVEAHYSPSIKLVSLHEGMTTSDFIEGLSVDVREGTSSFVQTDKMVLQLLSDMKERDKPGFLILDDIHRVNLVGVLGELLFAFSHRGEKITLSSGKSICVPENLYVFLTMNTLRPEFPVDPSIFGSFQIRYMDNGVDCLELAITREFYKSAYYGINSEIIDRLIAAQHSLQEVIDKIDGDKCKYTKIFSVEKLFFIDMSRCFDRASVFEFFDVTFPVEWNPRDDISNKYINRYNVCALSFCDLLNEAYEMYSRYVSIQTIEMLEDFIIKAKEEYVYYNRFLDYIAPEYYRDKIKYSIGYTYFLPGHGFSMWNAYDLLQNKIRAQVFPLLNQYQNEGIIVGCQLPNIERTETKYTRNYISINDERIELKVNEDYRNIFVESYTRRQSIDTYRQRGGLKYNSNYGVLFELLHDIILNPLINYWNIMEIFLYDKEIYFKLDKSKSWGSCLLCDSELAGKVRLNSSDSTSGNDNGVYRSDIHAFFYKGRKYYMVSKIKTENHERMQSVDKCRRSKLVKREIPLYGMAKVLVYNYLSRYLFNLTQFKYEQIDESIIEQLELEITLVKYDLKSVDDMVLRGANNDELRWNLLEDIRRLPTWDNMINGNIKGVYKIMDDRYQSVMNSTGIHQMILQGPPGTSKTYGVKEFLAMQARLISEKGQSWKQSDLDAHQLVTKNDEYILPKLDLSKNNSVYWDIVQFHPSYTYEDFVRGISVVASDKKYSDMEGEISNEDGTRYSLRIKQPTPVLYKTVNRTLGKMAKIARENYDAENPENSQKFYLVIDEINRANLATVFGELIYALEYRDSEVATPYSVGKDARLQIPNNLYIIGTMNTADKSIASIDYAIRRRFLFFPVLPDIKVVYQYVREDWYESTELSLFYIIERLFDSYMNTDDYNKNDVQIGHTYFLRKGDRDKAHDQMKNRFLYQVVPVIREYYNDGILIDDAYGKELSQCESECITNIKKMTTISDMDELDRMYKTLIEKLSVKEIKGNIKKVLEKKQVLSK